MSCVINNNLSAVNVANTLKNHYGRLSTSVQRLSSGLRINSAADDAAGLAIRELMRTDTAALNQGMRNANDAISLLQVADGALSIIDEKLIRMKELAEQAATGTYDSTQRMMIDSEFKAMAAEIDRIATATDFNGIKLLDGSLTGAHNGKALTSTGKMKIHFGTNNDSAEDYYYIEINDCTTKGLGLRENSGKILQGEMAYADLGFGPSFDELNNFDGKDVIWNPGKNMATLDEIPTMGDWYAGSYGLGNRHNENALLLIPAGTNHLVFNQIGTKEGNSADNDIQLFTLDGKHLAGRSPIPDYSKFGASADVKLETVCGEIGFAIDQYDASQLNSGAAVQNNGATMSFTTYNGMNIGYSGDGAVDYDNIARYEVLTIDHVTEDLVIWLPGVAAAAFKYYTDENPDVQQGEQYDGSGPVISINTQEKAQKALVKIDDAIVNKDKVRAHLGALQNRLENTVTNLSVQAENLLAAESRISDADVAIEMTEFVRNQILAQTAVAMLSQANSLPQMAMQLIGG